MFFVLWLPRFHTGDLVCLKRCQATTATALLADTQLAPSYADEHRLYAQAAALELLHVRDRFVVADINGEAFGFIGVKPFSDDGKASPILYISAADLEVVNAL